jgi:hypothetical protein
MRGKGETDIRKLRKENIECDCDPVDVCELDKCIRIGMITPAPNTNDHCGMRTWREIVNIVEKLIF